MFGDSPPVSLGIVVGANHLFLHLACLRAIRRHAGLQAICGSSRDGDGRGGTFLLPLAAVASHLVPEARDTSSATKCDICSSAPPLSSHHRARGFH